jgi:O-methyltransferase
MKPSPSQADSSGEKMPSVAPSAIGRTLRRPWWAFWRAMERTLYRGHAYTLMVPQGQRIYTPWFETSPESEFARTFEKVCRKGRVTVSRDRSYILFEFARRSARLPGDMAECGVFTGGTANLLGEAISQSGARTRLHLFDTFQGMPETSQPARDYHSAGEFSDTSLELVMKRLEDYGFVDTHPGFIPTTFEEVEDVPLFSLVHVDVDIYPSTIECCRWFWPRLCSGGVMIFDDYGFYPYRRAARAAVDEYFRDKSERPIALPTGQGIVIKA